MSYKIFDVVELQNGNRATILECKIKNQYKAEIVNVTGTSQGVKEIQESDIKKAIFIK